MRKYWLALPLATLLPQLVSAHCPLCTVAAGGLAVLAASLGVSSVIVGVLIGAFALALGLWLAGIVKKRYLPYQKPLLALVIFLATVIPIMPLVQDYAPLYLPFIGEYGTTYTINLYLLGLVIGAIIILVSPFLSKLLTRFRQKQFPYQGLSITIGLLILTSIIIQLWS